MKPIDLRSDTMTKPVAAMKQAMFAAQLGVDVKQITTAFDSISICLSKGLGAPIGSVIVASSI